METINNNQLMSDQIDQLATALSKAQAEFSTAKKDKDNPFFKSKYADFESVVLATRPALTKYGLAVSQPPVFTSQDGRSYLVTLLIHSSGQWIKSMSLHNPQKSDVQSLSSYNTYLKRMCYSSIVGAVTGENDDDGNSASHGLDQKQLQYLLSLPSELQAKICAYNKVNKLEDLTVDQYENIVSRLKK